MKYFTNLFRVGSMALLVMLILAPGAFAQQEPNPPSDVEAVATEDVAGSITITWSPVTGDDNGGFDVPLTVGEALTDGYEIEVSSDYDAADPTAATWTTVPAAQLTVTNAAPEADPAVPKFTAIHAVPGVGDPAVSYNLTRHYRVKARNVIGEGDPSDPPAMATTHNVPDAPTGLAAVAGQPVPDPANPPPQNGRITITWEAVPDANDGGLDITTGDGGYILEFFNTEADPQAWQELTGETAPTAPATQYSYVHDLSSLTPSYGITRMYRVRAVNAAGEGENATAVSGTTHDVPDAPTGLATGAVAANADDAALNDIPVSWNAVPDANNGGLPITGYELQFLLDPPGTTWATATGGTNTVLVVAGKVDTTHAGLAENATTPETYYYRVRAISAAGMGDWSSVTPGVKLALPGAPMNLIVRAVDQQESIDLFWDAPMNDGEPPVTGYRIERSDDYDPDNPTAATWETTNPVEENYSGRSYRDRGLTAGQRYGYRVMAINIVGTSPADGAPVESAISSNKALAPRNLEAMVADDMESIVLTWDGPIADEDNPADGGSTITGFQIEVDDGTGWAAIPFAEGESEHPVNGLITSVPGAEYTYTHTDVAEGTTYTYRVSAVNDAGPGHPSASSASVSIDAVVPGMPTALTATADMEAPSITLMWMAPVATGGADITSWKIEVSEDLTADPVVWTELDLMVTDPDPMADPPTTMFSATHAGLNAGATYHYRVSATNSAGTGDPSEVAMATAVDIPNAPTGLTATADGENTINLSWTAPELAGDAASAITGWKIEVSADYDGSVDPPTGTWADLDLTVTDPVAPATMHTASHDGLDPATTRHYRVSAMNMAGNTGEPSNVDGATTMAAGIVTAIRYAVSEDGSSDATCTDADAPCTLAAALAASMDGGVDTVLVRIRRASETATIGDATTINKMVTLGVYVRGTDKAAKGAVRFTESVKFAAGGDLMTHKGANLFFEELEVTGMSSVDKLTVSDDLTISEDDEEDNMTSVLAVDELTVNSGQTLTLGKGADVRVRLTKGAVGEMNGKLDIKGTVDGDGDLWIAHTDGERGADGFMLHMPADYDPYTAIPPSKNKFTVDDCLMVTGGGTVENDLYFVAAGNVCVGLGEVGNLVAVGSIDGQEDITTDVIFRNGVTVNGDIEQWNDARVAFEMSAMIDGDVTLEYGDGGVGDGFGMPISDPANFERAMGSGVEFASSSTIEGDLNLKFDGTGGHTQVLLNVPMSGGYHMTAVEGDLIIEDGGGIHLHGHPGVRTDRNNNARAHNLSAEGDVFVYSDATITQEHAATSTIVGAGAGLVCRAPGLNFGTKVMLSGDVVFTEGAVLDVETVVIADDVEVEEEGDLVATTVHITADGELDSDGNTEITSALVLEGDGLEGSLAPAPR